MLTFPVGELADRCLNAWLDITDEGFSHAILPSTQLAERFSTLMESDADQTAWDEFYKAVGEEFSRLSADELAAFFIDLNDPSTIEAVLWSDGEHEFLIPVANAGINERGLDNENQSQGTASHPHYS